MNFQLRMGLAARLVTAVSLLLMLAALDSAILIGLQEAQLMREELERYNTEKLDGIAELLEATGTLLTQRVHGSMGLLREYARGLGAAHLGETVGVSNLRAPDLLLGDRPQANDAALVNTVTAPMGGTATLFVRSGDDFVRVSSNIKRDYNALNSTSVEMSTTAQGMSQASHDRLQALVFDAALELGVESEAFELPCAAYQGKAGV